jgi:light-regulated signal transduction histidine kinase (bacteriophytochrome)
VSKQNRPAPLDRKRHSRAAVQCSVPLDADSLHDLGGPVNQISSITELIVSRHAEKLEGEAAVLFGFIRNSASQLQGLMAGLRNYMRVAAPENPRRRCASETLLEAAIGAMQPAIEESGAIVTHDALPELFCNPDQLIWAFSALIENSIKFRAESRPAIHISAAQRGRTWEFSIRDNGMGMDPRHCERVFGVFKRIHHDQYGGAGMGLPIVRRIVEQSGGRVWAESQPGAGCTFFFALPQIKPAGARAKRAEASAGTAPQS